MKLYCDLLLVPIGGVGFVVKAVGYLAAIPRCWKPHLILVMMAEGWWNQHFWACAKVCKVGRD